MDLMTPLIVAILSAIGIMAVFIGLVLTPWQVFLVLLLSGLVLVQWLMEQNNAHEAFGLSREGAAETGLGDGDTTLTESATEADNALTYRGINYQQSAANSPAEHTHHFAGKYRGCPW